MYLKISNGERIRVGKKSEFKIEVQNREVELLVKTNSRGNFQHVAWFYGRAHAERYIVTIKEAIERGDKVFEV